MNGQTETINIISNLLEQGNASELEPYLDEQVMLSIMDEEVQVPKANALATLKDFFLVNPPKSFSHKHDGKSKEGNIFAIGAYKTEDTELRTYYVLKDNKIQELCIEIE